MSRSPRHSLRALLEGAAGSAQELRRVRALLDPHESLRFYPLELAYREMNGDPLPRRLRLWNTLGHFWAEAEFWDHDGGRFWREVVPLCRIEEAEHIEVRFDINLLQLRYIADLRDNGSPEARFQHRAWRLPIHWAIEQVITDMALTYPLGVYPELTNHAQNAPQRSREHEKEIWLDAHDLTMTALKTSASDSLASDSSEAQALGRIEFVDQKVLLKETLAGNRAALTYSLVREGESIRLNEVYQSDLFGHTLGWSYPLNVPSRPAPMHGVYLPVDTVLMLIEDQQFWSHWAWALSADNADIGTLARCIHPSGDAAKIREYLGANASDNWHHAVNTACKFDLFAVLATCSLNPTRNVQISRRLRLGRARTSYFRLFYNGGVLVGTLLKHAWAFGWGERPIRPQECSTNLHDIAGRTPDQLPKTHNAGVA